MTDELLADLKKLAAKHPCVQEAYDQIIFLKESPFFEGYVTMKTTIDRWNKEIQEREIQLTSNKDDKGFDRAIKYLTEINVYYDKLEYFRLKLTPEKINEANKIAVSLFERARQEIEDNDI